MRGIAHVVHGKKNDDVTVDAQPYLYRVATYLEKCMVGGDDEDEIEVREAMLMARKKKAKVARKLLSKLKREEEDREGVKVAPKVEELKQMMKEMLAREQRGQ